jgi:hypothetical protein
LPYSHEASGIDRPAGVHVEEVVSVRIVKLSKDVFGFDTVEGCIAYFEHVLPWGKYRFRVAGEGSHISADSLADGEILVFSYVGTIVAAARAQEIETENGRVTIIRLREDTLRVFSKRITLKDLENTLKGSGYSKVIHGSQGWNIIDGRYEEIAIRFLIDKEWEDFIHGLC